MLSKSEAAGDLGGYTRANVEALEGRYVCFRPAFSGTDVISAYLMFVHWDERPNSCLTFEERDRVDAGHTQSGQIYLPDGRPFMSFFTVAKGAIRVIMVSRPDGKEPARGLIMTLSNPGGAHFTPASAPIVLRRVVDETPKLGYIRLGTPACAWGPNGLTPAYGAPYQDLLVGQRTWFVRREVIYKELVALCGVRRSRPSAGVMCEGWEGELHVMQSRSIRRSGERQSCSSGLRRAAIAL